MTRAARSKGRTEKENKKKNALLSHALSITLSSLYGQEGIEETASLLHLVSSVLSFSRNPADTLDREEKDEKDEKE